MTISERQFETVGPHSQGRFAELLRQPATEQASHNQPLLEGPDWVIAPTLGAIVPNWLIAVPRKPAISLRDWKILYDICPRNILEDLNAHLTTTFSDLVWFEHGPTTFSSTVGCGTDYAHMHIILRPRFSFVDFADQSVFSSNLTWKRTTLENAYENLPNAGSYLIAGSGNACIFASHVESVGSQFFRRVVSVLSGQSSSWNYKQYPHMNNVAKTIENFRKFERLAVSRARISSKISFATP